MTAQTARLLVDGNGQIIPNQYYDSVTNSFTEVSSSNPLPVANAGYHYSVTGKTNADGVVTLTATQIPTLAAVWQNRITISKGTATSGTLGIKIKLVGATAYSTLLENGSAVVVNFASITEPTTYVFDGDIEGWQITPTSVVGA